MELEAETAVAPAGEAPGDLEAEHTGRPAAVVEKAIAAGAAVALAAEVPPLALGIGMLGPAERRAAVETAAAAAFGALEHH